MEKIEKRLTKPKTIKSPSWRDNLVNLFAQGYTKKDKEVKICVAFMLSKSRLVRLTFGHR